MEIKSSPQRIGIGKSHESSLLTDDHDTMHEDFVHLRAKVEGLEYQNKELVKLLREAIQSGIRAEESTAHYRLLSRRLKGRLRSVITITGKDMAGAPQMNQAQSTQEHSRNTDYSVELRVAIILVSMPINL